MSTLLDKIKAKKQAIASKSNREKPAKLSSAKNFVRILPNWAGDPDGIFFHDFGQHFIKDVNGQIQAVYVCTANTFGKSCDVCHALAEAAAGTTDETIVRAIAESKASSRTLVNAVYINGPSKTEPVLLELPPTVFGMILSIAEEYWEQHQINIFDLKAGHDVTITKEGSGRDTRYTVTPSPKAREVAGDILSKCKNLEEYVHQEYEAGLQKALTAVTAVTGHRAHAALPAPARPALSAPGGGLKASGSTTHLAAAEPIDMDEIDALAQEAAPIEGTATHVSSTPTPVAAPAAPAAPVKSAATAELDEIEAMLNGA